MSDQTSNGSGGNAGLAFILGGVVVALAVLGWVVFGGPAPTADQPDIRIELPGVGVVEGEVRPDGN